MGFFHGPGSVEAGGTLIFRYNFIQPNARVIPHMQIGAGGIYTDIGERESRGLVSLPVEFNLQGTGGLRFMLDNKWSLILEAGYRHISNGTIELPNRGVDSVGGDVGLGFFLKSTSYDRSQPQLTTRGRWSLLAPHRKDFGVLPPGFLGAIVAHAGHRNAAASGATVPPRQEDNSAARREGRSSKTSSAISPFSIRRKNNRPQSTTRSILLRLGIMLNDPRWR